MENAVNIRLHQCRCFGAGEYAEERCREMVSVDSPFCAWCEDRHSESAEVMGTKVFYINLAGEVAEG